MERDGDCPETSLALRSQGGFLSSVTSAMQARRSSNGEVRACNGCRVACVVALDLLIHHVNRSVASPSCKFKITHDFSTGTKCLNPQLKMHGFSAATQAGSGSKRALLSSYMSKARRGAFVPR